MSEEEFYAHYAAALEIIGAAAPDKKVVVIVFDPDDDPAQHTLYSDAPPSRIIPVIRAASAALLVAELRRGDAVGVTWLDGISDSEH